MSVLSLSLLFGSAILHTTWNLILKQAGEKYIAMWWCMLMGSLLFVPAVLVLGLPARDTWLLLAISALLGAGYFVVLSFAYNTSDFSLVYPMSRGAAPGLIAVWSVLFLREHLTAAGVSGLLLIVAGLVIIGASEKRLGRVKGPGAGDPPEASEEAAVSIPLPEAAAARSGIWLALLMALIISLYSVIDGAAVKRTGPVSYAAVVYFVSSVYMTPYVLVRHGWGAMKQEFAAYHWRLLLTGALIVSAYLLALWAFRLSSVSYSGAIREVGVVLGALAGWQLLGEKFGALRVLGACVIFAGIVVIALMG